MEKVDEDHFRTSDGRVVERVKTIIFNVPIALQDEATELIHERGYSKTEVGNEGVRSLSDKEGIWRRRRDFAVGHNPVSDDGKTVAGDVS